MDGISGISARKPAASEYEICFKCHANSSGKPQSSQGYATFGRMAWRVTDATAADPANTRLEFSSSAARHNVTMARRLTSTDLPSIRATMLNINGALGRTLASGTFIYCGDCHNNDQARNAGGTQSSGVHGSSWPHILERRYEVEPLPAQPGGNSSGVAYQAGLSGSYGLCYKCHNLDNILQDRSFSDHNKHIQGENTSCSTCHDSHGINGGTLANNARLINFDTRIVAPSSSGILRFDFRPAGYRGRCYLTCHGKNHNPYTY